MPLKVCVLAFEKYGCREVTPVTEGDQQVEVL